jgi:hypothetical protein
VAFSCAECGTAGSLDIVQSIVLAPDSRSDDIILQLVRCRQCRFRAAAVYEESRRGRLDSESWEHIGYRLSSQELAKLSALMARCPAKKDSRCLCSAHQALGQRNDAGRWQPPFHTGQENAFPMRRA